MQKKFPNGQSPIRSLLLCRHLCVIGPLATYTAFSRMASHCGWCSVRSWGVIRKVDEVSNSFKISVLSDQPIPDPSRLGHPERTQFIGSCWSFACDNTMPLFGVESHQGVIPGLQLSRPVHTSRRLCPSVSPYVTPTAALLVQMATASIRALSIGHNSLRGSKSL